MFVNIVTLSIREQNTSPLLTILNSVLMTLKRLSVSLTVAATITLYLVPSPASCLPLRRLPSEGQGSLPSKCD